MLVLAWLKEATMRGMSRKKLTEALHQGQDGAVV